MKKRLLSLAMAVAMIFGSAAALPEGAFSQTASAAVSTATSGKCGENVYWSLEDGVVTIIGVGDMTCYDKYENRSPFANRNDISSIVIKSGVTSIGDYTFANSENVTSIIVPNSVARIGADAFYNTYWLYDQQQKDPIVTLNTVLIDGKHCSGDIIIPEHIKSISASAFEGCYDLTSVVIPSGVTCIENCTFLRCTSLIRINIPDTVNSIDEGAFNNCLNLTSVIFPKDLTHIGRGAFAGCEKLSEIVVPRSVTSIGEDAFEGTKWLKAQKSNNPLVSINNILIDGTECTGVISIPSNITQIGGSAFWRCTSLKGVIIPNSVTTIGPNAFYGCYNITSILFPDGLLTIDHAAFYDCINLKTIVFPKSVSSIGSFAFSNTKWLEEQQKSNSLVVVNGLLIDGKTSSGTVIIPDNVNYICAGAFASCRNITALTIPSSVDTIDDSAFAGCNSLSSVNIEHGVKKIGTNSFRGCVSLESITIPYSVDSIGDYAFDFCQRLNSCRILNPNITIGNFVFYNIHPVVIKCSKDSSAEKYAIEYSINYEIINCRDHDYIRRITKLPSCTEYGYNEYTCKNCGNTYMEKIETVNHTYSNWKTTVKPTCTAKGSETRICSVCKVSETREIKALGHDYAASLVLATCNSKGYTLYKCSRCGDEIRDNYTEPTGNHKWSEWKTTDFDVTKGTSTQTRTCSVCNKTETKTTKNAIQRLAGSGRYETAVEISKAGFPDGSDTVVLAYGLNYADALAGVSLAKAMNAPILLTNLKTLPNETLVEIKRLGASNVIILGGTGAVGEEVEKILKENNLNVERIAGKTRFETATKIAGKMQALNDNKACEDIFFVYAFNSADALSVSAVAAVKGAPVIYLKTNGELDDATANYLKSVKGSVKNAYVIGGSGVISDDMMKKAGKALGVTPTRVFGKDRFATCVAVNNKFKSVLNSDGICVATGMDFPDALAGGVYAAINKAPLFLVNGKLKTPKLSDEQKAYLKTKAAAKITAFGGTGVVPDNHIADIAKNSI